jgi:5'-3' exonuclease
MGIKYLNKYLRMNCKESIRCIPLNELKNKKIVIDTSIYLYKYEAEDTLMENMFLMISVFKKYKIIPIFVFDGKSPTEKKALIQKRIENRSDAQKEYNILKEKLVNVDTDEKQEIINIMDQLKKKIIYITKDKIQKVKDLIQYYGANYIEAPNEADELCASLVIKKKAWACLSEDMDMFVYGCSRVLRYLSLLNHNVVLYYYKGILKELKLSSNDFKDICIITGTDYNINNNINIFTIFNYYYLYLKHININTKIHFYNWLLEQKDKEKDLNLDLDIDIELLYKIKCMFSLYDKNISNIDIIKNNKIDYDNLKNILQDNGFVFVG